MLLPVFQTVGLTSILILLLMFFAALVIVWYVGIAVVTILGIYGLFRLWNRMKYKV